MSYEFLKLIHILGASVLFGTGLGIAFFMFAALRLSAGNGAAASGGVALTARIVVVADMVFTATVALLQPITGSLLVFEIGYRFSDFWVLTSLLLYLFIGLCWFPVLFLQKKMRDLAVASFEEGAPLPDDFYKFYKVWFVLGWPAFLAMLVIFYLMIVRPSSFGAIFPF